MVSRCAITIMTAALTVASLSQSVQGQWGGLSEEALVTDIDLDARDGDSGYVSAAGVSTQQQYSANSQIRSVQVGSVLDLQYNVDNGGRIVGITENGDEQRFAYNADGLVVADTKQGLFSYGYDNVGNRTSRRVRQADELTEEEIYRYAEEGTGNRLLERIDTFAGVSQPYTYNATGAPIQRGQLRYEYDAKEQLTALYRDEQLLARYAYNGFGERIRKVVYSQGRRPTITYFLYSGSTLVAEADESGEITAQYQYLEDHRPVLMLQGKQAFVIHTDHLGTPRVVSDEQGEIRWQASYTPFGKAIITQADIDLPLRFPGQYADAESGTHYNYLRDYDPGLGRYLRSDPIGLSGGLNTYAYVAGNPLGAIDPLGLQAQPAVVDLPNVSDEVRRIVNQRGLRGLVDTTGRVAANQPIPPPRPGVPATSVLRGLTRVNALVTIATVSFTLGHEGAALADALYFAPADHAEVLAHIRRYDPDYSPTGTALQVDREGIRALGSELLRAQGDFLIANANSCTAAVETTQLWYDANWAINGAGALPPVPLSQQQIDDLAYEDYKANGGTLSRDDWERDGKPADDQSLGVYISGDYQVRPHGDQPEPRPQNTQSHHGVMSAYMRSKYSDYNPRRAPAVLLPTSDHQAMNAEFNRWAAEIRGRDGVFSWDNISEADMRDLADRQFVVGNVPRDVVEAYWRRYNIYVGQLTRI